MSQFDSLIIGEVAQDTNVDYDGTTVQAVGGAVYYSGFAAANICLYTAFLPKADTIQIDMTSAFAPAPNVTVSDLLCHQKRLPHPGPGAADLHRGQHDRALSA